MQKIKVLITVALTLAFGLLSSTACTSPTTSPPAELVEMVEEAVAETAMEAATEASEQATKRPTLTVVINKATNMATITISGTPGHRWQLYISEKGSTEGTNESGTFLPSGVEIDLVQAKFVEEGTLNAQGNGEVKLALTGIPAGTTLWFQAITAIDDLEMSAGIVEKSKVASGTN